MNSSLLLAASTPVVSSCQSSAPPPSSVNAVNDGSLPTNISEDAQQSSGTYKISTTSLIHTCSCAFASVENLVMSVTENGLEIKNSNCFQKEKNAQLRAMSIINFSINWTYLESSCFYFTKCLGKWLSSVWMTCLKIWNFFWKGRALVIKSRAVCFSPCSFTFNSLRCYTMSSKIHQFPFIIH